MAGLRSKLCIHGAVLMLRQIQCSQLQLQRQIDAATAVAVSTDILLCDCVAGSSTVDMAVNTKQPPCAHAA